MSRVFLPLYYMVKQHPYFHMEAAFATLVVLTVTFIKRNEWETHLNKTPPISLWPSTYIKYIFLYGKHFLWIYVFRIFFSKALFCITSKSRDLSVFCKIFFPSDLPHFSCHPLSLEHKVDPKLLDDTKEIRDVVQSPHVLLYFGFNTFSPFGVLFGAFSCQLSSKDR